MANVYKHIRIKNSNMLKKRVFQSRYNKIQKFICKLINVVPLDKYQYTFHIEYQGTTKIKKNDILINSEEVAFMVFEELNRKATLVTFDGYIQKPKVFGNLFIITEDKEKQLKIIK